MQKFTLLIKPYLMEKSCLLQIKNNDTGEIYRKAVKIFITKTDLEREKKKWMDETECLNKGDYFFNSQNPYAKASMEIYD